MPFAIESEREKKGLGSSLSFPGRCCCLKEVSALGDVARLVECLPSVKEALGWIPSSVYKLDVLVHTWNPGTQKVEARESEASGSFVLHSKLSQPGRHDTCLKKQEKNQASKRTNRKLASCYVLKGESTLQMYISEYYGGSEKRINRKIV